jgi:lipopolysaccharide transport system permease protein
MTDFTPDSDGHYAPPPRRGPQRWQAAVRDLRDTVAGWRLWVTLGQNDIGQRYRRSRIGQFWITASMAVFIAAVGSIYAVLFRMELRELIPHIVIYFTAWTFMSTTVNEGTTTFIEAERYLRQEPLPKLAFVMRVVWRNVLAYLHNLLLLPIAFVVFLLPLDWGALTALGGIAWMLVNTAMAVVILGVLCTRFRDLRQVVANVVQLAFFASPIMWRQSILPERAHFIVDYNPIAAHLRLIGDPLIGEHTPIHAYALCALCTLILLIVAIPVFVRFRERIIYWL